jgi:hypothetical protein
MALEEGTQSCHGKMKLEGTFAGGLFTSMKIYRLFQANEKFEIEDSTVDNCDEETSSDIINREPEATDCSAVYTRCKGISRRLAENLSDSTFNHEKSEKTIVKRNALRANKTGEISLVAESRSVSAPFNLKRYVTKEGLHTYSLSETNIFGPNSE